MSEPGLAASAVPERLTPYPATEPADVAVGAFGAVQRAPIPVDILRLDPDLDLPAYAHAGDAGADLCSAESFVLQPGERRLVGTGLAVAVPAGFAAFVHPRSGLAARYGLSIVNAPGTVDAGYRGEVKVCLVNTDRSVPVSISRGDRIAQLVIQPVAHAEFRPVTELPSSARGAGGYGSTGGMLADAQLAAGIPGRARTEGEER